MKSCDSRRRTPQASRIQKFPLKRSGRMSQCFKCAQFCRAKSEVCCIVCWLVDFLGLCVQYVCIWTTSTNKANSNKDASQICCTYLHCAKNDSDSLQRNIFNILMVVVQIGFRTAFFLDACGRAIPMGVGHTECCSALLATIQLWFM